MTALTDFYDWIITQPNLIAADQPFADLSHLQVQPLAENSQYHGNRRLGFLYQHLCTEAFKHSDNYHVAMEEIQLNQAGKTLGAIDLILHNQQRDQLEHWEVAIKFYLLHQGTWFGPNAHDQLDKKLDRMLNHQLAMSCSDTFHQQYPQLEVASHHLLMQGRLYTNPFSDEITPTHCLGYPLNDQLINGYWCYYSQSQQIKQPLFHLPKERWAIGLGEQLEPINPNPERFIHAQTKQGQFWFVVPDCWPHR